MQDQELLLENVERRALRTFAEQSYLDYSMYVVLDRALPNIADGLKPVQRRIVFAMHQLHLSAQSKPKKSARTVGDVIGKFHPHGDSACYEAMVNLAQPFNARYPLIDGQGNWGAQDDPKSFAAMRYTESRLTGYAASLLADLDQGTTEWQDNFDATLQEPVLLPARLPNGLLNGAMGIAVGMSTDIPPHNLREVVDACVRLLDTPNTRTSTLLKTIKGPDFATGGMIAESVESLHDIYETGNGSIKVRARYRLEKKQIVVTELPYQASSSKIVEQIAAQMRDKKLPMVSNVRDESDHKEATRLCIFLSGDADPERVMNHLFATTDLERSVRINLNMIGLDGKPRRFSLRAYLEEWLIFRVDVTKKRLLFRLEKIKERLHLLDGFKIAYLNLDEIIQIIRSEEEPRPVLQKRFKLSEIQAQAILDMRLKHLARLEEQKIIDEHKALSKEQAEIKKILSRKANLNKVVQNELRDDAKLYGDDRRTEIVEVESAQAFADADLVTAEPATVILSTRGWVRVGKGHEVEAEALSYKAEDGFLAKVLSDRSEQVAFLDSTGRSYSVPVFKLPTARGYGDPLSSMFDPPAGAHFTGLCSPSQAPEWTMVSSDGYGFIAPVAALQSRMRAGKAVIKVKGEAEALAPQPVTDVSVCLALVTTAGKLVLIELADMPEMNTGKGVKLVGLDKTGDDRVVAVQTLNDTDALNIHTEGGTKTLKGARLDEYLCARGRKGKMLPRGWRSVVSLSID